MEATARYESKQATSILATVIVASEAAQKEVLVRGWGRLLVVDLKYFRRVLPGVSFYCLLFFHKGICWKRPEPRCKRLAQGARTCCCCCGGASAGRWLGLDM